MLLGLLTGTPGSGDQDKFSAQLLVRVSGNLARESVRFPCPFQSKGFQDWKVKQTSVRRCTALLARMRQIRRSTTMGMPWRALGALACLGLAGLGFALGAQWPHIPNASPPRVERLAETDSHTALIQVDGIFPQLAIETDAGSATLEHSVSALIPWSNRLWVLVSSEERTVQASGLYEVNADFKARLHQASAPGRHANRLVHQESAQAFLGPYAIDSQGTVRVIDRLVRERIAATARHLADPAHRVYHLTFDGVLFETVVDTLETRELANLKSELKLSEAFQFEFRTACSAQSRLVVGAVGDVESGRYGRKATGLLAQWDGESWSTVQECPVVDLVTPLTTVGDDTGQIPLYGVGWDDASIRLFVLIGGNWQKYRLPWGESCPPNVVSQTLRLRPFQAGHMLLSVPGLVYEVTTTGQGHFGGVVPVARNLGSYADLTFWRGLLVFAGHQTLGDRIQISGLPHLRSSGTRTDPKVLGQSGVRMSSKRKRCQILTSCRPLIRRRFI